MQGFYGCASRSVHYCSLVVMSQLSLQTSSATGALDSLTKRHTSARFRSYGEFWLGCQTLGYTRRRSEGQRWRKSMFHLIWYVLIGLISGVIAKSVMHVHMTIFWTIMLGIIGSIHRRLRYPHVFAPGKRSISSRRPHFLHTRRDPASSSISGSLDRSTSIEWLSFIKTSYTRAHRGLT